MFLPSVQGRLLVRLYVQPRSGRSVNPLDSIHQSKQRTINDLQASIILYILPGVPSPEPEMLNSGPTRLE